MKGQATIEYLVSFIIFTGLIVYVYLSYSSNIPRFIEEVRKEDIRSKAFQLSEILINDPGNPVNWMEPSEVPVDVVLVIDISSSMDGDTSPPPNWGETCKLNCSTFGSKNCIVRPGCTCPLCPDCDKDGYWADPGESPCSINDAKNASKIFVNELNDTPGQDRAGIVIFNTTAEVRQSLTNNKAFFYASVDTINANHTANTSIGAGIRNATQHFKTSGRSQAKWIQVLLTDGMDYPVNSKPEQAAKEANATNITIYTIGLGPLSYFNETLLKIIANITGGKYYHAPSSTDLGDIYRQIAYEMKFRVDRIGFSDETLNKTNLISMRKLRLLEDLCSSFENVQQKLAFEEPFSISVFNISLNSGLRNKIIECAPPNFSQITNTTTITRIVTLINTETMRLEAAEVIIQM